MLFSATRVGKINFIVTVAIITFNLLQLKFQSFTFFSGADLAALVREASVQRLKDLLKEGNLDQDLGQDIEVMALHFEQAFEKLRPSVSVEVF